MVPILLWLTSLVLVLAGLVLFFFVLTYLVVTILGIIPMEDQDIFRST